MTCLNFFDAFIDNHSFHELLDEMYWNDNFRSDKLFDYLLEVAKELNIELIDAASWDYDKHFYNCYKNAELGLS